jgi:hypothetical protein
VATEGIEQDVAQQKAVVAHTQSVVDNTLETMLPSETDCEAEIYVKAQKSGTSCEPQPATEVPRAMEPRGPLVQCHISPHIPEEQVLSRSGSSNVFEFDQASAADLHESFVADRGEDTPGRECAESLAGSSPGPHAEPAHATIAGGNQDSGEPPLDAFVICDLQQIDGLCDLDGPDNDEPISGGSSHRFFATGPQKGMSADWCEGSLSGADDDFVGVDEGEEAQGRQRLSIIQQCQDAGVPDSPEPLPNAMELDTEIKSEDVTQQFTQAVAPRQRPIFGLMPRHATSAAAERSPLPRRRAERSPLPRRHACAGKTPIPSSSLIIAHSDPAPIETHTFAEPPQPGATEEDCAPPYRRRRLLCEHMSCNCQHPASNHICLGPGSTGGDARKARQELEATEKVLATEGAGEQQQQHQQQLQRHQQHQQLQLPTQTQLPTRQQQPTPKPPPRPRKPLPAKQQIPTPKHMLPTMKQPPMRKQPPIWKQPQPPPPPQPPTRETEQASQQLLSSSQAAGSNPPGSGVAGDRQITARHELETTEKADDRAGEQQQQQQQHQHQPLNSPAQPQLPPTKQQPTPKPPPPPQKPLPGPQMLPAPEHLLPPLEHMWRTRTQPPMRNQPLALKQLTPPPQPPQPPLPPPPKPPLPQPPSPPATPASQRRLSSKQSAGSDPPGNGVAGHQQIIAGSTSALLQRKAPVVPATTEPPLPKGRVTPQSGTQPEPHRPIAQAARRTREGPTLRHLSFQTGKAHNHIIIMCYYDPTDQRSRPLPHYHNHMNQCCTRYFVRALCYSCYSHCHSREASAATPVW